MPKWWATSWMTVTTTYSTSSSHVVHQRSKGPLKM